MLNKPGNCDQGEKVIYSSDLFPVLIDCIALVDCLFILSNELLQGREGNLRRRIRVIYGSIFLLENTWVLA